MDPSYIAIVDAGPNETSLDVYGYSDFSNITEVGAHPIAKGISQDTESLLSELLKYATEIIPAQEVARTPLYLYGRGHFRGMDANERHELLRRACRYVKDNSKFLIGDCATHVDYVDEQSEASLSWIAANYPDKQLGVIDWSTSSLNIAFPSHSDKSRLYRVAYGSTIDLATSTFDEDYFESNCTSWDACAVSLPADLPEVPLDLGFLALDRFNTFFGKYHANIEEAEQCEDDCYAARFGFELKSVLNLSSVSSVASKWTLGRAILYAALDSKLDPVGIQPNTGAHTWTFGKDDSIPRPPRDFGARLDARSHRFWGGIALVILLATILYFLLGSERRQRIWAAVTRRPYRSIENDIPLEEVETDDFNVE